MAQKVSIFWLRRDLRLHDNAGLYHALKSGYLVLPVFIFDPEILDKLEDKADARVTFIHQTILALSEQLQQHGSSILVKYAKPADAWLQISEQYNVAAVYTNNDYEPYAAKRDETVKQLLSERNIPFHTFKDQVIFEKNEVVKDDGKPYTVFTPYKRKWYDKLSPFYLKPYPTEKYLGNLYPTPPLPILSPGAMGFEESTLSFPGKQYRSIIADYAGKRDFPAVKGTSHIGLHLRFGTLSIRELAAHAYAPEEKTWLNELIWRDFYAMILYHFPHTTQHAFKPEYDCIIWRNNGAEFKA